MEQDQQANERSVELNQIKDQEKSEPNNSDGSLVSSPQTKEEMQQQTPEKSQPRSALIPFETTKDGLLVGSTFEQEYRLARAYAASGLMPKGLNTPEKVLVAVQLCRELGLPPMSSVSKIMVLNGSASIFGDLPLALVMKSGKMTAFKESWTYDKEGCAISAQCYTKRKDIEIETTREFSLQDAKLAGLIGGNIWTKYPKRMLQFRARTWALKDTFPDVLSGVSIGEWDMNAMEVNGKIEGSTRRNSSADKFNEDYLDDEKAKDQEPRA